MFHVLRKQTFEDVGLWLRERVRDIVLHAKLSAALRSPMYCRARAPPG